jgi:hypothetical protein
MQPTHHSSEVRQGATAAPQFNPPQFPPLEQVTRPSVNTAAAAFYLSRKPQTLRMWACYDDGPIRPQRIHGRLAWGVADLRSLLGLA